MIFSLMPPTGRTFPVRDTSPVIARFCATGTPIANDNNAVTMVQPALGPSFGVAPYSQQKNDQPSLDNEKVVSTWMSAEPSFQH